MTLGNKLGKAFEDVKPRLNIKTISIEVGDTNINWRVRVPVKREIEELTARIMTPTAERIESIFQRLSAPVLETLKDATPEFKESISSTIQVTDNDVVIDGKSVRQIASLSAIEEARVEEYFRLLVSETDEPINESYDQITAELPEFFIREVIQAIEAVIRPDYKATKKN